MPLRVSCPAPFLCLACFGGGVPVPFPPYLAWGGSARPGRSRAGGWVGGGGGLCAAPPVCAAGGASRAGGSLCLVPSLCLAWAGNKAGVTGVVLVMEGVAPIPLRFMPACRLLARPAWRPGALVRVRLFPAVPAGAGDWGGGAGLAPPPLSGAAVPPWGRGDHPLCLGGLGAGAAAACGPAGRSGGGGGGFAPPPPCSPSGGRPPVPYPAPRFVVGVFPPGVRVRSGSLGRPVHRMRTA